MEKQDFTIQDIKEFMLTQCKLKWYGEILDDELGQYRTATIEDFSQLKRSTLFVVKTEDQKVNYYDSTRVRELNVIIFGDIFRIPRGRDYSKQWQEFKSLRKIETLNA